MTRPLLALLALACLCTACCCGWWYADDDWYDCDDDGWWCDAYGCYPCYDLAYVSDRMEAAELDEAKALVAAINTARLRAGVAPLAWAAEEADVAYDHALDMDVRNYLGDVGPDGEDASARLARAGLPGPAAGECVAAGDASAREVAEGWLADAADADLLLDPCVGGIGVGVHATEGATWWVALLRR